jgi:hypothetical protein
VNIIIKITKDSRNYTDKKRTGGQNAHNKACEKNMDREGKRILPLSQTLTLVSM